MKMSTQIIFRMSLICKTETNKGTKKIVEKVKERHQIFS